MSELELEQGTNIKFLVKLGKSGNEIREMLVQVYEDNAMKKTAVYSGWKVFLRDENVSLTKSDQDRQEQAELKKKYCKSSSNCGCKSSADCQEHSRASQYRQRNS